MMPESARIHELRRKTGPLHRRLEAHPVNKVLLETDLRVEQYVRFLLCLHDFWQKFPTESESHSMELLREDLRSLRISVPDDAEGGPLTPCQGISDRLAREYLMIGSSLGGAKILQYLKRRFGPEWTQRHARFLARGRDQTSLRWPEFLRRLETAQLTLEQERALYATAQQLFRAMLCCCERAESESAVGSSGVSAPVRSVASSSSAVKHLHRPSS